MIKSITYMEKRIYLCLAHMGGHEMDYIREAFDTNWVVPLGPNVNAFEEGLERFVGEGKKVVALSAGTAAIHLGLLQLGVQAGDEVICQSFTFCASANPVTYLGATPVFVDSEEDTWNMSPALLEEAIRDRIAKTGKKPKAIIPVHLYKPLSRYTCTACRRKWTNSWKWRRGMGFRCWRMPQRRWVLSTRAGNAAHSAISAP